jgi:N-acetyl-gamma-glutamylphosphate reductase
MILQCAEKCILLFHSDFILHLSFQGEEFVKLLHGSSVPHTRHVVGSNYCFMNVFEDRIPGRAKIISVVSVFSLSYHA